MWTTFFPTGKNHIGSTESLDADGEDVRGLCVLDFAGGVRFLGGDRFGIDGEGLSSKLDRNASIPSMLGVTGGLLVRRLVLVDSGLREGENGLCGSARRSGGADALDTGRLGVSLLRLATCPGPFNPLRLSDVLPLLYRWFAPLYVEGFRTAPLASCVIFFFFFLPFFNDFLETMAFRNRLRSLVCVLGPESDQLEKLVTSLRQVRRSRVLARVMAT